MKLDNEKNSGQVSAAVDPRYVDLLSVRPTSSIISDTERNAQWLHDTKARGKQVGVKYRDKLGVLVPELKKRLLSSKDENERHEIRTALLKAEQVLRYGDIRASIEDRSTDHTVVEYAMREVFKGKTPRLAARATAKKLAGGENMFIGQGTIAIDEAKLEAAIWDRFLDKVKSGRARGWTNEEAADSALQTLIPGWDDKTTAFRAKLLPDLVKRVKGHTVDASTLPKRPDGLGMEESTLSDLVDMDVENAIERNREDNPEFELDGYGRYGNLDNADPALFKALEAWNDACWDALVAAVQKVVGTEDPEALELAIDECESFFEEASYLMYMSSVGHGVSLTDLASSKRPRHFDIDDVYEALDSKSLRPVAHDLENTIYIQAESQVDRYSVSSQDEHSSLRGPDHDVIVYRFDGTNNSIAGASARGMYVAKLASENLRDESSKLGHCIGNPTHGHPQLLKQGFTEVFSIRTSSGATKFSIERFIKDGDHPQQGRVLAGTVSEVKGYSNRLPGFAHASEDMTKPDEVRYVVDFLVNHLGLTPAQILNTHDIAAGVLAMQAQGIDPFKPPVVRKRSVPNDLSAMLLSASKTCVEWSYLLSASVVSAKYPNDKCFVCLGCKKNLKATGLARNEKHLYEIGIMYECPCGKSKVWANSVRNEKRLLAYFDGTNMAEYFAGRNQPYTQGFCNDKFDGFQFESVRVLKNGIDVNGSQADLLGNDNVKVGYFLQNEDPETTASAAKILAFYEERKQQLIDLMKAGKVSAMAFKKPFDGWKNLKPGKLPTPVELEDSPVLWASIAKRVGHDPDKGIEMRAPIIGGRRRYHHRPLRSYDLSNHRTITLTTDELEAKTWNNLKSKRHPAMPRIYDVFSVRKKGDQKAQLWAVVHEQLAWPVPEDWDLFMDTFFRWRAMEKDALQPAKASDLEEFLRFIIDPEKSDPKTVKRNRAEEAMGFDFAQEHRDDVAQRRTSIYTQKDLEGKVKWAKSALQYLRQNKVQFRDFDPSNLAITKQGDRVVITNLAESRSAPARTGRTGRVKGSLNHDLPCSS